MNNPLYISMFVLIAEASNVSVGMVISSILWTILLITQWLHSSKIWYLWFSENTTSSEKLQSIKQVLPFGAAAFLGSIIGFIWVRLIYYKLGGTEKMGGIFAIAIGLGVIPAFLTSVFWYIWKPQKFLPLAHKILLYIIHSTFVLFSLAIILIKYFKQIFEN